MNIDSIGDCILDETSTPDELCAAMDGFVQICSEISGIKPDRSFDAWAEDTLLASGVAINPQAAAHCAVDYQRSIVFIRGVYAALNALKLRFPNTTLEILYAGCGPFATLLLPVLGKFSPGELAVTLLDIHQSSLDSAVLLLDELGLSAHQVQAIRGDACLYKHDEDAHLVIAETMQKSLEQEPQFAVTANLAPQLGPDGIFIPQSIEVTLCLADLEHEKELIVPSQRLDHLSLEACGQRYPLTTVCDLLPEYAADQMQAAIENATAARLELNPTVVTIPEVPDIERFNAVLFTRIRVFGQHGLQDYECEITLPLRCYELEPLKVGQRFQVSYQLGEYPKFDFDVLDTEPT
ncbi:MAG: hypothetical protein ACI9JM_002187 [Halioglobus sp.]|jgi:hypothetical protein